MISDIFKLAARSNGAVFHSKSQQQVQAPLSLMAPWQHCLIIPAFSEPFQALADVTLNLRPTFASVLQIWVINCPDNADREAINATRGCLQDALINSTSLAQHENILLRQFTWGVVLIVDRVSSGLDIPHKKGVGYARKIGADIACQLHDWGFILSDWCCFTDADVTLPADYFKRFCGISSQTAGLVFPHSHKPEGDRLQQQAIRCYQYKLNHHVAGLFRAGSPYAWHSIGSTICCRFEIYKQVRGMPARAAGEDFYFLNKLAKVGQVESLSGDPVVISGRSSLRVPFGTGPSIAKALQPLAPPIRHYHPLSYDLLAILLNRAVPALWENRANPCEVFEQISGQFSARLEGSGLARRTQLPGRWIFESGLATIVGELLAKSPNGKIFKRHFHCWFDGFRTLKFIHWWRDQGLHDVQVEEAVVSQEVISAMGQRRDGRAAL